MIQFSSRDYQSMRDSPECSFFKYVGNGSDYFLCCNFTSFHILPFSVLFVCALKLFILNLVELNMAMYHLMIFGKVFPGTFRRWPGQYTGDP